MAARPTPRPWRLFHHGDVIEIHDAKGEAVVFWQGFDRSERSKATHLANARLIVTAVNGMRRRDTQGMRAASGVEGMDGGQKR